MVVTARDKARTLNHTQIDQNGPRRSTTSVWQQGPRKENIGRGISKIAAIIAYQILGRISSRQLIAMRDADDSSRSAGSSAPGIIASGKRPIIARISSPMSRLITMIKLPEAWLSGPNAYRSRWGSLFFTSFDHISSIRFLPAFNLACGTNGLNKSEAL